MLFQRSFLIKECSCRSNQISLKSMIFHLLLLETWLLSILKTLCSCSLSLLQYEFGGASLSLSSSIHWIKGWLPSWLVEMHLTISSSTISIDPWYHRSFWLKSIGWPGSNFLLYMSSSESNSSSCCWGTELALLLELAAAWLASDVAAAASFNAFDDVDWTPRLLARVKLLAPAMAAIRTCSCGAFFKWEDNLLYRART